MRSLTMFFDHGCGLSRQLSYLLSGLPSVVPVVFLSDDDLRARRWREAAGYREAQQLREEVPEGSRRSDTRPRLAESPTAPPWSRAATTGEMAAPTDDSSPILASSIFAYS